MADTTHVAAFWDGDSESAWVDPVEPGDHDGESRVFEGDVPTELWEAHDAARKAWTSTKDALLEALGFDEENGRLKACCPRWRGYTVPSFISYDAVIPGTSVVGDWPSHAFRLFGDDDEPALQARINELPEEFVLIVGRSPKRVRRDSIVVKKIGVGVKPLDSACEHCGWPRVDHADAGEARTIRTRRG